MVDVAVKVCANDIILNFIQILWYIIVRIRQDKKQNINLRP